MKSSGVRAGYFRMVAVTGAGESETSIAESERPRRLDKVRRFSCNKRGHLAEEYPLVFCKMNNFEATSCLYLKH